MSPVARRLTSRAPAACGDAWRRPRHRGGVIEIGVAADTTATTLIFSDGTSVTGGALTFGGLATDTLDVEGSATLDDVTVTGGGVIEVGVAADTTATTLTCRTAPRSPAAH